MISKRETQKIKWGLFWVLFLARLDQKWCPRKQNKPLWTFNYAWKGSFSRPARYCDTLFDKLRIVWSPTSLLKHFAHLRSKLMAFNVRSARLDRLKRESVLWRGSPESLCTYDFCFIKRKIWFSSAAVAIPNYGLKLLQARGMNVDGMSPHCLIFWSLLCKQFCL